MPVVQTIPFMLEKERHLLYNWNAFMKAELELTKIKGTPPTALEVFKNMAMFVDNETVDFTQISLTDLLILVWSGLIHEDPKLTLDRVGDNLLFADLSRVIMAVSEAIAASIPKDDEVETVPLEVVKES
jgi:hypothetical protein